MTTSKVLTCQAISIWTASASSWSTVWTREDGACGKRVTLSVLGVNDRAYQLYRRLGFTEVSRDGVAPEVRIRMVAVGASR
jgi:hypothetical protein